MIEAARKALGNSMLVRSVLGATAMALVATTALAKPICITSSYFPLTYVFEKPSIPPPGALTSFSAVVFPGSGTAGNTPGVAQGTIYTRSDGKLRVGLSAQGMLATGLVIDHFFDDALVNRAFKGTDVVVLPSEQAIAGTWSRDDCSAITLP